MSPDFILICLLKAPFLQDPHLGFLQCHFQLAGWTVQLAAHVACCV